MFCFFKGLVVWTQTCLHIVMAYCREEIFYIIYWNSMVGVFTGINCSMESNTNFPLGEVLFHHVLSVCKTDLMFLMAVFSSSGSTSSYQRVNRVILALHLSLLLSTVFVLSFGSTSSSLAAEVGSYPQSPWSRTLFAEAGHPGLSQEDRKQQIRRTIWGV